MANITRELEAAGAEPRLAAAIADAVDNRIERKLNRRPSGLHPEWVLGIAAAIIAAAIGALWVEVASIRSEHGERLARVETQLEQIQTTQAQILTQVEQVAEKID